MGRSATIGDHMTRYLLRRTVNTLVLLLVLVSFVFLAGRMIGDPALNILGLNASGQALENFRENTGLNDPLFEQYGRFLTDVISGDFGVSYRYGFSVLPSEELRGAGTEVLPLVLDRLPATFRLAGVAIFIAVALALGLGLVAAMRPGSWVDRIINIIALAGVSIVQFWLGLVLIVVVSVHLGWLPTSGYGTWQHVILPALTLAARPTGRIAQVVRSSMLDELSKPYVETARSKGASTPRIVLIHTLKNASVPIVTMIGDELGALLTGAVLVETVFAWPGVGLLLVDSLVRRDLPLIQAAIFVVATLVILVNFAVDVAYSFLDPKIRLAGGRA